MAFDLSNIIKQFKGFFDTQQTEGIVGIDIGSSSIKVVELHNNKDVPTLSTYGELQLGPYADIEIGRTTNLEVAKLAQALIDIVRESSVGTKTAALSISYNSSFVTVVTIPSTDPTEIGEKVSSEARKYIPVPINTVSLDWFTVGAGAEPSSSKVLIAAIHNDSLKKYHSTISGAGLSTKVTEIEVFSTIRSAVSQNDGTVAVIDIGASGSRLYIAEQGTLMRTHSLRMGGAELTSLIASTRDVAFDKAEEIKRSGFAGDDEVKKAVTGALERAFREVGQVINRHQDETGQEVDKVLLSGGGALLAGIDTITQDVLGKPVERTDPFSKVAYPAFLEDVLKQAGPSFSVAIGAALQELLMQK